MKLRRIGRTDITNCFFVSVAALLFLTGVAKLYSATGTAKILSLTDPILHVNNRVLMVALGLLETGLAIYLLARGGRTTDVTRAMAVLWLSGNFMAYRVAVSLAGITVCPCLGTLASKLPLSRKVVDELLTGVVLYWFLGSALILLLDRHEEPAHARPSLAHAGSA